MVRRRPQHGATRLSHLPTGGGSRAAKRSPAQQCRADRGGEGSTLSGGLVVAHRPGNHGNRQALSSLVRGNQGTGAGGGFSGTLDGGHDGRALRVQLPRFGVPYSVFFFVCVPFCFLSKFLG